VREWITAIVAVVALVMPYLLGWIRRPRLEIGLGPTTGEHRTWRFLHLTIYNKPLGYPWRWVERREPATGCHVKLTFLDYRTKGAKFQPILARWSPTPEPLRIAEVSGQLTQVVEPALVVAGERFSLDSTDEGATVGVAVKHDGSAEAYAFNGYSYYYPKWANPDWELPQGEYIVRATAISGQESASREFKVINQGSDFKNFRLEEIIADTKRQTS
jgi:hypothetical protein